MLTNYVALMLVGFGQPCLDPVHVLRIAASALRGTPRENARLYGNVQPGISQTIRKVSTSVVVLEIGSLLCQSSEICCYNLRQLRHNNERNLQLHIYNFVPFDVASSVVSCIVQAACPCNILCPHTCPLTRQHQNIHLQYTVCPRS